MPQTAAAPIFKSTITILTPHSNFDRLNFPPLVFDLSLSNPVERGIRQKSYENLTCRKSLPPRSGVFGRSLAERIKVRYDIGQKFISIGDMF